MTVHLYEITGRKKNDNKAKVYRMKVFAPNTVVARSRFWYYLSLLKKVKRANGEVISIREVFEKNPNSIKNFGMWIRYDSRSGTHNMYKEYRDCTVNGAVTKMYAEMASRHRARQSALQIVKTAVVKGADAKRENTTAFLNNEIAFRLPHRVPRAAGKEFRKVFKASRPCTFY